MTGPPAAEAPAPAPGAPGVPASEEEVQQPPVYKLAIVGGGPAAISILVRAARLKVLEQLLDDDDDEEDEKKDSPEKLKDAPEKLKLPRGVLLVEAGGPETLGMGQLGKYEIRSNTYASKLVEHVLGDKFHASPPEGSTGTPLECLRYNPTVTELLAIGPAPAPLGLIAKFMSHVAQIFYGILNARKHSTCLCKTRVVSLQRTATGFWRVNLKGEDDASSSMLAEHVAICVGAVQEKPDLDVKAHQNKVMTSDDVLTKEGIHKFTAKLKNNRVCIVGGSHSAFSVAWICLKALNNNAPQPKKDEIGGGLATAARALKRAATARGSTHDRGFPSIDARQEKSPEETTQQPVHRRASADAALPRLSPKESSSARSVAQPPQNKQIRQLVQQRKKTTQMAVTLLHRSPVKVFYSSKKEAETDEYRDFTQTNRFGQIHAFGGLRGDAKVMHRDIVHGRESRVRMCQIKPTGSKSLMAHCFDDADVIVWATGYKSRRLPVLDEAGNDWKLLVNQGQVQVDATAAVLQRHPTVTPVPALYASGHGFGLPAVYENGDHDGSKGRADGLAVYMRQAATHILAHVMHDFTNVGPTSPAPPNSPTKGPLYSSTALVVRTCGVVGSHLAPIAAKKKSRCFSSTISTSSSFRRRSSDSRSPGTTTTTKRRTSLKEVSAAS